MKLNKSDKEAFVRAVMDDVPVIDYQGQAEALVNAAIRESLPPKVRTLYDDKEYGDYVQEKYVSLPSFLDNRYFRGASRFEMSAELRLKLTELGDAARAQHQSRKAMESRLNGVIGACTTLKAAKEMLPEFEKYLPAERDSTSNRSMPAIANIVSELTAAGWPKEQVAA